LYGIDPYPDYIDWDGNQPKADINKALVLEKTKDFKNFTMIEKTSDDAAELFEDGSMDFIFVDGLHTYEQVLKDCQNYWPKLKSGGYLIGHDYTKIQDVNRAATEFIKSVGKEVETAKQDLWYIIKD
jgi:predicted O-methyltransferase YrrM